MMELDDRYSFDTDCDYPPDFTKGYPLPEGWHWTCYDDGSGCLDAPDGTSYFEYDLACDYMSCLGGLSIGVLRSDEIARMLKRDIIPLYGKKHSPTARREDAVAAGSPEPTELVSTATLVDLHADSKPHDDGYDATLREGTQMVSGGKVVTSSVRETPVSLKRESRSAREAANALMRGNEESEEEKEEVRRPR